MPIEFHRTKDMDLNNWICDITAAIDIFLKRDEDYNKMHSYVYISEMELDEEDPLLSIRIPGCAIGYIEANSEYTIVDVKLYEYSKRLFVSDPSSAMRNYVGQKIVLDDRLRYK